MGARKEVKMNEEQRKLFWDIAKCPAIHSHECDMVISEQSHSSLWQIPEPWSGDLEKAEFLILGCNPAYDEKEIYPSTQKDFLTWNTIVEGSERWTEAVVESFFANRFAGGKCPGYGYEYVRCVMSNPEILVTSTGGVCYKRVKNNYWSTYLTYCNAICKAERLKLRDSMSQIVLSDLVHCKGGGERGVSCALKVCCKFLPRLVKCFLSNNSSQPHSIIVFGPESRYKLILNELEKFSKFSAPVEVVGAYAYKRKAKRTGKQAYRRVVEVPGIGTMAVYYNLPSPSGSNRSQCPVKFLNDTITW